MNENMTSRFNDFLEYFSGSGHDHILDVIKHGFTICFESYHADDASTIRQYMAKTFFASAWADYEEQVAQNPHGGVDIMDVMPDNIPESAFIAADKVINFVQKETGKPISELYNIAANTEGKHYREPTEEDFAYSLAMQSMGHGVGWSDNHPDLTFKLPHLEYSYYDLPEDEYPIPEEEPESLKDNKFEHLNDEPLDAKEEHFNREPDPNDHFKPATLKSNLESQEKRFEKFQNFLESLKGYGKDSLLDAINSGFKVCFESLGKTGRP